MRPTILTRTIAQHNSAAAIWGAMGRLAIASGHNDTQAKIVGMTDEVADLTPLAGFEGEGTLSDDHRARLADAIRESGYGEIFNQFSTIYAEDECSDRAELFRTLAVIVEYGDN